MTWIVSNSLDISVFFSNLSLIQGFDANLSRGGGGGVYWFSYNLSSAGVVQVKME